VAAAGILLWRRDSLWCWYVSRASGFCDVIGISLIEKKIYDETHNGLVACHSQPNHYVL